MPNEYKLHHPVSMLISGSSGTGKTTFIINSIRNKLYTTKFKKIWLFYAEACPEPPIQVNLIDFCDNLILI